ncbi:hypothetical protein FHR83_004511 [Actinoplanes campanulatus]|uniref:Uncharacterized protein n=1 Tax=Actinoplanes campanulatus TaxID=113559 RepID=A0A7W5FFX3_9ACTN|nr:hypothetical protein [Actinoplanes campanulatus]MBB3096837.1 hypothetical protein [Actinoplanes campanulatus]GGN44465.1 hypothetical protein GCM10010109_77700 [Actinoplanes campanulatus]GID37381.1 hypothetical protein Aca09nite_38870 [Actinoplanes campanulatus]
MATIADDLNAIVVRASSPDGRIEGEVESLRHITLRFVHDSYEGYYRDRDAVTLAHQLGRGATLMAAAYQRARRVVMRAHSFERYSELSPPFSPRHRDYLERGARLTAHGSSPDGEIVVTTVGLLDFHVSIAPDVLERHDEREFLQLADRAMRDLQVGHQQAHTELRHEMYLKYRDRER